jgi:hypothetical protein
VSNLAVSRPTRSYAAVGARCKSARLAVRSTARGKAFIAKGNKGVELALKKGGVVFVGSQRRMNWSALWNSN